MRIYRCHESTSVGPIGIVTDCTESLVQASSFCPVFERGSKDAPFGDLACPSLPSLLQFESPRGGVCSFVWFAILLENWIAGLGAAAEQLKRPVDGLAAADGNTRAAEGRLTNLERGAGFAFRNPNLGETFGVATKSRMRREVSFIPGYNSDLMQLAGITALER